jgi:hypothetical protein
LKIENFGDARSREDVMASLDPFIEAESHEKSAEVAKTDVGIGGTSQHTCEYRIGHRFIVPQYDGYWCGGGKFSYPMMSLITVPRTSVSRSPRPRCR